MIRVDRVIAIVGRPNVGKSALFNRMAGKRIAIIHDRPGVTRDRISATIDWRGKPLILVDTGGIGLLDGESAKDAIANAAVSQTKIAIESASVLILVVSVRDGVLPLDAEVARRLRSSGKPVIIAANKADDPNSASAAGEFCRLGFETILPISAIHGRGILEFRRAVDEALKTARVLHPQMETNSDSKPEPLKLAIVGRPNVGKSSIVNAFDKSQRVIVSPIPGTTRDCVDVPFAIQTDGAQERYLLIDTAGIRKRRRVSDSIEFFSVKRSENAIARADIVLHVFDAQDGVTMQDKKIADIIVDQRKACIFAVNKWDLYAAAVREAQTKKRASSPARRRGDNSPTELSLFAQWVRQQMFFLDYAPVIFTSAHSGFHLDRLLETIRYVAGQLKQSIPTAVLNRALHDAFHKRSPSGKPGGRLKFYYAVQVKQNPPAFLLFVNRKELFTKLHEKHLARELRKAFGYEGCPLLFLPKERPQTIRPIRKPRKTRLPTKIQLKNKSRGHNSKN